jgi:effector-binding domain-containing protein
VYGRFREIFSGETLARCVSDIGEHGLLEQGATDDLVWEVDPTTGAKVYAEPEAASVRRSFALLRGARPESLYRDIALAGTQTLDGREHAVLRMIPKAGKPDTGLSDPASARGGLIDTTLPTSDGANLVWGLGEQVETQITLGDWKRIDGINYPHRRAVKMGIATFVFNCEKIEPNAKIDAARFTPPEAVTKLKGKPVARVPAIDSGPSYQIQEREAQSVASVRLKCKPADISATLAVIFPEVIEHLNAAGAKMTGNPFTRYHGMDDAEIDLEAGLPVAKPVAEKGRVKNGTLPGGRTVVAWHVGPYEQLVEAHEALRAYLDSQQLRSRGGPWEIYWTDPGVVPDSSKWRTQLFMPIEN